VPVEFERGLVSQENWLPVVGWEGVYEVSDIGRVRRVIGGTSTHAGRLLNHFLNRAGYPHVRLRRLQRAEKPLVHRLVAMAFIGPPPTRRHEVNHKNGDRNDPRSLNLEWVTRAENNLHAFRVLHRPPVAMKGERNWKAKLTDGQVVEIRQRHAAGETQTALAREFGVSQPMVGYIVRGENWRHVA
jgi:hypothetical protein